MTKYKKHTPEGSQDYLFQECCAKRSLEGKFEQLFRAYGFREIETPTMEYYDVFAADREAGSMESMFKFFDPQGRILVLRPDMTIPIARAAATKLTEEAYPLRISYVGNAFKFIGTKADKQKESTQAGIELLGLSSVEADAEVISVAVKGLLGAGFQNFQIDIGQVAFFKGLMEEGGFSDSEVESIRVFIDKKDMIGVEQILREHDIQDGLRDLIMNLPTYFGNVEILEELAQKPLNERSRNALSYLRQVVELLYDYGCNEYVSIDLGMVQRLNYYTGVIFRGFTYGIGFPVLSGGRYDGLVGKYGSTCPSVGFSVNINHIMTALERQNVPLPEPGVELVIGYGSAGGGRRTAISLAQAYRSAGKTVELELTHRAGEELIQYGKSRDAKKILFVENEEQAELYSTAEGSVCVVAVKALLKEEI